MANMNVNTTENMSYAELQKLAAELTGEKTVGVSKAKLIEMINSAGAESDNEEVLGKEYAPELEDKDIEGDTESKGETEPEKPKTEKGNAIAELLKKPITEMTPDELDMVLKISTAMDAQEKIRKLEAEKAKAKADAEVAARKVNMRATIAKEPKAKATLPWQEGQPERVTIKVNGVAIEMYADEEKEIPLCHAEVFEDSQKAKRANYRRSKLKEKQFKTKQAVTYVDAK